MNQAPMASVKRAASQTIALARWACLAVHSIHVGRRSSQVIDIAFETGMPLQAADFLEDRFFVP
jgi:hypothetical protein